jgi:hypothetical protein
MKGDGDDDPGWWVMGGRASLLSSQSEGQDLGIW